jgi:hypothetical protein
MATLAEALQGLNYTGADTGYGIAATTLGQMTPQLINPYGSTGQAIGISLGSVLLQSLLGYQARQQAARDTLELNTLANQLMTKTTPEARTEFIGTVSDPMNQSRLSTLSTALMQQEAARQADLTTKRGLAELEVDLTRAKEMGVPLAQLSELDKQREARRAALFGATQSATGEMLTVPEAASQVDAASILARPEAQQVLTKPEKEALAAQAKLTADRRGEADTLRKEFNALPEVKNFSLIDTAAKVVSKAVQDPSAVATQELVRRAVQLIEPGMAVREGEQAAIMASQSIPDRFKGELEKALSGQGGLQEETRAGIMRIAQRAYEAQAERYKATKDFYEGMAEERGIPKKAISYIGEPEPWAKVAGPQNQAGDKQSQLSSILQQLQSTTDPAKIKELKQQAADIYGKK